jgi:hypothetical protein
VNIVPGLRDPASHTVMFGQKNLARDPEPTLLSTGKFFQKLSAGFVLLSAFFISSDVLADVMRV